MKTSTGLMLTALALYTNMEAPLGSLRYSRPQSDQPTGQGESGAEAEAEVPEPEGEDQAALRSILGHYYAKLERRETMRPDRDLPSLYDSMRELSRRRE